MKRAIVPPQPNSASSVCGASASTRSGMFVVIRLTPLNGREWAGRSVRGWSLAAAPWRGGDIEGRRQPLGADGRAPVRVDQPQLNPVRASAELARRIQREPRQHVLTAPRARNVVDAAGAVHHLALGAGQLDLPDDRSRGWRVGIYLP